MKPAAAAGAIDLKRIEATSRALERFRAVLRSRDKKLRASAFAASGGKAARAPTRRRD